MRRGYVPALDGLRGIAILLVLGYHTFKWPHNGWVGVDLFFVLSGFLITTLLLRERRDRGRVSLRAFYRRRARRLVPAMLVLVLVVTAVEVGKGRFDLSGTLLAAGYLGNLVNGYHWPVSSLPDPLGPLWSLATEEQFYIVWPLLLLFVLRARPRLAVAATIVAATAFTAAMVTVNGEQRLLFSPDTRPVGLAVGCLVAILLDRRATGALAIGRAGGLALALCVAMSVVDLRNGLIRGGLTIFVVLAGIAVVAASAPGGLYVRALELRPLTYVGRISYSLYLWHVPVLLAFGCLFSEDAPGGLRVAAALAAVAVAAASYHLVEQPFRKRRATVDAAVPAPASP